MTSTEDRADCVHLILGAEIGATKPKGGCRCGGWSGLYPCDLFGTVAPLCVSQDAYTRSCQQCDVYQSGRA